MRPTPLPEGDLSENEIEITSEMLDVGCHEFYSFDPGFEDAVDVVRRIWIKMEIARRR